MLRFDYKAMRNIWGKRDLKQRGWEGGWKTEDSGNHRSVLSEGCLPHDIGNRHGENEMCNKTAFLRQEKGKGKRDRDGEEEEGDGGKENRASTLLASPCSESCARRQREAGHRGSLSADPPVCPQSGFPSARPPMSMVRAQWLRG